MVNLEFWVLINQLVIFFRYFVFYDMMQMYSNYLNVYFGEEVA